MIRKALILLLLIPVVAVQAFAQDLISVADLAKEMKNPEYVIVSGVLEEEYSKVHITGSVNIPYKAFFKPGSIDRKSVV
mgnify:FL=1